MRRTLASLLYSQLLITAGLSGGCSHADTEVARENGSNPLPNFIIIYCDDLGYGDIGPFGSTVHRTPNLDRMAEEGIRLTSFYVTSGVCTPSRSSLLTGCYPRRVSMHKDTSDRWVLFPVAHKGLNPSEVTLAEVLKERGYATAIVGKWHLGDQPPFLPTRQGFDSYFGIPYSNDMGLWNKDRNYPPLPLLRDDQVIETEPDQTQLTRRYTGEIIRYIREHRQEPFFAYLPHTMPHNPVAASAQFAGQSANDGYGDAVEEIDWSTGQILDELVRLGLDERTLVLFTSDNGAARRWGGSNAPLSGYKGSTMEGGMRVPFLAWWPGQIPAGSVNHELATTMDLLPTLAHLAGAESRLPHPIDGHQIWPLLSGENGAVSPYEAFFYYYREHLQAVRSGPWKLHLEREVAFDNIGFESRVIPPRLYNLDEDVEEATDLSSQNREVVGRLLTLAQRAREDLGDGGRPGKNQRPAGYVDHPRPLVK